MHAAAKNTNGPLVHTPPPLPKRTLDTPHRSETVADCSTDWPNPHTHTMHTLHIITDSYIPAPLWNQRQGRHEEQAIVAVAVCLSVCISIASIYCLSVCLSVCLCMPRQCMHAQTTIFFCAFLLFLHTPKKTLLMLIMIIYDCIMTNTHRDKKENDVTFPIRVENVRHTNVTRSLGSAVIQLICHSIN